MTAKAPFWREHEGPTFFHRNRRSECDDMLAVKATQDARMAYEALRESKFSATSGESLRWKEFVPDGPPAKDILSMLRTELLRLPPRVIIGLARKFRVLDEEGSGFLERRKFDEALADSLPEFLSSKNIESLFRCFSRDSDGEADHKAFLESLRVPMSSFREKLVERCFQKLDLDFNGFVDAIELARFFEEGLASWPDKTKAVDDFFAAFVRPVRVAEEEAFTGSSRETAEDVSDEFTAAAAAATAAAAKVAATVARRVTLRDFLLYFSHMSACDSETDESFEVMIQNAFGVTLKNSSLVPKAGQPIRGIDPYCNVHLSDSEARSSMSEILMGPEHLEGLAMPESLKAEAARRAAMFVSRSMPAGGMFSIPAGLPLPPDPETVARTAAKAARAAPWIPAPGDIAGTSSHDGRDSRLPAEKQFRPPPAPYIFPPGSGNGDCHVSESNLIAQESREEPSSCRDESFATASSGYKSDFPSSLQKLEGKRRPGFDRDTAIATSLEARMMAEGKRKERMELLRDRRSGIVTGCLNAAEEQRLAVERIEKERLSDIWRVQAVREAEIEAIISERMLAEQNAIRSRRTAQWAAAVAERDAFVDAKRQEHASAAAEEAALLANTKETCSLSSLRFFPANDTLEAESKQKATTYAREMPALWKAQARMRQNEAIRNTLQENNNTTGFIEQMHENDVLQTSRKRAEERAAFQEYATAKDEKDRLAREQRAKGMLTMARENFEQQSNVGDGAEKSNGLRASPEALYGMCVADLRDFLISKGREDLVEHLTSSSEDDNNRVDYTSRESYLGRNKGGNPKQGYKTVDDVLFTKLLTQWEVHDGSDALRHKFGFISRRQANFLVQILGMCHDQATPWKSALYRYYQNLPGNDPLARALRLQEIEGERERPAGVTSRKDT